MTFLETLQANHGELLKLNTQLWWYQDQRWDKNPGRICLIMKAFQCSYTREEALSARSAKAYTLETRCGAELFMDGSYHWIWLDEQDVEFIANNSSSKSLTLDC